MELDETGDLGQLGIAAQPHLLEVFFGAFLHAESVHGNEHLAPPGSLSLRAAKSRARPLAKAFMRIYRIQFFADSTPALPQSLSIRYLHPDCCGFWHSDLPIEKTHPP